MIGRSLLVVLAHPDDESFGMGGTLARYASEGVRVTLVCATRGEAGIEGLSPEQAGQLRERELCAAAAVLGIAQVTFMGYRDGELALAEQEVAVNQLVTAMREAQPQVVITFGPDGITGHPDHVAIHQLTSAAFDRAGLPARLYYLAPSAATQQACGVPPVQQKSGGPVAGIDVSGHLLTKVRAMQCHTSQQPPYPGKPEEEAARLACHEYFFLARPPAESADLADLFAPSPAP
ncbi:MAG: PIG-L deacetylase family protein [Anaerolineae bacterium]